MLQELDRVRAASDLTRAFRPGGAPRMPGFDDGTIIPAASSRRALRTRPSAPRPPPAPR
ncbi:hypothetical protein ACFQ1I_11860 [Kitasatospora arboriphila]